MSELSPASVAQRFKTSARQLIVKHYHPDRGWVDASEKQRLTVAVAQSLHARGYTMVLLRRRTRMYTFSLINHSVHEGI